MRPAAASLLLVACAVLGGITPASGGDEPPAWLTAACTVATPEIAAKAPAVELFRERRVRVDAGGTVTTTTRRAVRILNREGREAAAVREYYVAGAGSVREIRAWMIRPAGKPAFYGAREAIDASMVENEVYDESRVRAIVATDDAEVGAVFGSESIVEEVRPAPQLLWNAQDRLPVVRSSLTVTTPSGWDVRSITFNHPAIEPRRDGGTWVWTAGDLPYRLEENWSPPLTSLAPRVTVTLVPPAGDSKWNATRFEDWQAVARWVETLAEPRSKPTEALVAKARSLVAGRSGEWERIEAIAAYVQGVHYIAIQTGIARGGGYQPHAAGDVFAKSYGDCKDKANLLRTMLAAVGIRAHLVLITSDNPDFVREEWPSPYQFNHCIAAIAVGEAVQAPAVQETAAGRLLIFDPTDTMTPLGQLPFEEQGSLALVVAGSKSELVRVPSTPAKENGMERTIEGRLDPGRVATVRVVERAAGRDATDQRRHYRSLSKPDYRKGIERWISECVPGASVTNLEVKDDFRNNRFELSVEFDAPGFVRTLPGGLLAVRSLNLEGSRWRPRSAVRSGPLLIPGSSYTETTELQVPQGYVAEECFDPVRTEAPFGTFRAECDRGEGGLRLRRELELKRALLPAEKFEDATRFFDGLRSADQLSVVLAPATPSAPASSR